MSRAPILIATAAASLGLLVPGVAQGAKRHGVQRNYAGAAWAGTPQVGGFYARLRLDRAFATDRRTGGFAGQTFWTATNKSSTRFGRNKRTPYVSVSISRGFKGRDDLALVIAQRSKNGRYFEGRSKGPAIEQRHKYPFSIIFQIGGVAKISLGGEQIATAKNTGEGLGGNSAYAGIESSSGANQAGGSVDQLAFLAISGKGAGVLPGWGIGDGHGSGARLIKRGKGKVGWTRRLNSFTNSFGP